MSYIQEKLEITTKALEKIEKIEKIAGELIANTPEYDDCYYKDKCGNNCPPKKAQKIEYCLYEKVYEILSIINDTKTYIALELDRMREILGRIKNAR